MTQKPTSLSSLPSEDFLSSLKAVMNKDTPKATRDELEAYIKQHSFDIKNVPSEDSHVFFYNGVPIGSKGNIIAVTGKAKSRKTVVASAIASSVFLDGKFLGFHADVDENKSIVHIDTEQGYYHYYNGVARILKDAHLEDTPRNFLSLHTRDATTEFRCELLEYVCETLAPEVIILDGITDFVSDINDQHEAKRISELLMRLSYALDALIIVVIHTTKTTGYMTGAVGTALEKKAQTVIKVERDDDKEGGDPNTSHVYCQYARDKGFPAFSIQYQEEKACYDVVLEGKVTAKGRRGDKSPENYELSIHSQVLTRAFSYRESIPDPELRQAIRKAMQQHNGDKLSITDCIKFVKWYNAKAMIFQNPEGAWMRPPAGYATSNHTAGGSEQTGHLFPNQTAADEPPRPEDHTTDDLPF